MEGLTLFELLSAVKSAQIPVGANYLSTQMGIPPATIGRLMRSAEEEGYFRIEDVIDGGCRKMIRRHPHVFPEESGQKTAEKTDWDEIKRREKGYVSPEEELRAIPSEFPALMRAQKVYRKKKKIYGNTHTAEESADNIRNMLTAFPEADDGRNSERIAEILYEVCAFAEEHGVNAEQALADRVQDRILTENP